MRANFARHGRRILACRSRSLSYSLLKVSSSPRRILQPAPVTCRRFERTFIKALFDKPPRDIRRNVYEPGWDRIMAWNNRMLDDLRPHPREELTKAWRRLMEYKIKSCTPLNSTQAQHCWSLLNYLSNPEVSLVEDEKAEPLSQAELALARKVLIDIEPIETTQSHCNLAHALYKALTEVNFVQRERPAEQEWLWLVKVLSRYGDSVTARNMLYDKWDIPEYAAFITQGEQLLYVVAKGLAREGKEEVLLELVEHAKSKGVPLDGNLHAVIVQYYASRDRVKETIAWFETPIHHCHAETYRVIALFARRNNLQEWAVPIFRKLAVSSPTRRFWHILLQSLLFMGRSLSEVATLMEHMVDYNKEVRPTVHTINSLLGAAIELQNYQLAQEILQLGDGKGINMNGESFMRMMQLCIHAQDFERAHYAYEQVKYIEPWINEVDAVKLYHLGDLKLQFASIVNEYLVALVKQRAPKLALILSILESVEKLGLRLEPATVSALSLVFLEYDRPYDVMDILSVYSFLFSETEREVVQATFVQYCMKPETSTARAWASYQLLQQYFKDTSIERRTQLMNSFFKRKRADMATLVFGHMRQHDRKSMHPRVETYVAYFEGLAGCPDAKGLEMVHNMLKMDTTVQEAASGTWLQTALMLAYAACDRPVIALDLWQRITRSTEGPSYASLEAVFWTLERKTGGERMAREIWDRIEHMDLEVSSRVYNAYIGAVAGGGLEKEVRALVLKMSSVVGVEPEPMTIAIAYNALPGKELQSSFENWVRERYKTQWDEVLKFGRHLNVYDLWQFKIERDMRAEV